MTDLPLYLPEGVYLKTLVVDPDFSTLSELMQRAVVLLVLGDDENLKINGLSPVELIPQSTVAGAPNVVMLLNNITPYMVAALNSGDGLSGSSEKVVSNITFSLQEEDSTTAKISINLTTAADNETESTVVYQYD